MSSAHGTLVTLSTVCLLQATNGVSKAPNTIPLDLAHDRAGWALWSLVFDTRHDIAAAQL